LSRARRTSLHLKQKPNLFEDIMNAIYDACRSLLLGQRKNPQPLTDPQIELMARLWDFERRNRGHRYELDRLGAAAAISPYSSSATTDGTRKSTIYESTGGLLAALCSLPEADLPQAEAFKALWTARDTTGLLKFAMLQRMKYDHPSSTGAAYISEFHQTHKDGTWTLKLKFRHFSRNLSASRELTLPAGTPDTLQACCAQLRDARRAMRELLDTMPKWPEFSDASIKEEVRTRARTKLSAMLKDFSADDLRILRSELPQLLKDSLIAIA
jgi:hypothetical protein